MSKALTLELIHMKTKTNRIDSIKNLNLWGNDLNDISIVNQMNALEVLSLSVNFIQTLKDVQYCHNLRELYLRKNMIGNLHEVRYLTNLRKLRILWLGENPVADHPMYRLFVIQCLPQIERLDNQLVTAEEKEKADQLDISDLDQVNFKAGSPPKQQQQHQQSAQILQNKQQQQQQQQLKKGNNMQQNYDNNDEDDMDHHVFGGQARALVQRSPPSNKFQQRDGSPIQRSSSPPNRDVGVAPIRQSPKNIQHKQPYQQQEGGMQGGNYNNYMGQQQQIDMDAGMVMPQSRGNNGQQPNQYEMIPQQQLQYQRAQTAAAAGDYDSPNRNDILPKPKKIQPSREQFRNENILCAIIALMKELDKSGLEFVKKDCDKRLSKMD